MTRVLVLLVLLVPIAGFAADFPINTAPPITGADLLRQLQRDANFKTSKAGMQDIAAFSAARGYVLGIAIVLAERQICIPPALFNQASILTVVRAHLEQNLGQLGMTSGEITRQALVKTFPCQAEKGGGAEAPPQVSPIR